jgi:protein TonB
MLNVLLESRAARPRRTGGAVASAVMHGVLIAAAVALARPRSGEATEHPVIPHEAMVFVAPRPLERRPARPRAAPTPRGPIDEARLPAIVAPVVVPDHLPSIDVGVSLPPDDILARRTHDVGGGLAPAGAGGLSGGTSDVIDAALADRAPSLVGHAAEPRYPASLRDAGLQGRVVVQFVVDTLGRPEMGDVQVVEATHPLFVDAVRTALARYRFTPGEAGGHSVRTRVQIPFQFTLSR